MTKKGVVAILTLIIGILAMIMCYYSVKNNKLETYVIIASSFLVFIISVILIAKSTFNIFCDLRIYLVFGYFAYNFYVPINYCFKISKYIVYENMHGAVFSYKDMNSAVLVSFLYLVGMCAGLVWNSRKEIKQSSISFSEYKSNIRFYYWLILFFISMLWYLLPYFKFGFNATVESSRWFTYAYTFKNYKDSFGLISKASNLLFNTYLVILVVFMLFIHVVNDNSKLKRAVFAAIFLFYTSFILFIDLRRREVLILAFMMVSYYVYMIGRKFGDEDKAFTKRINIILISFCFIFIFFIAYGYMRQEFKYANHGINYIIQQSTKSINDNSYLDNEFGMVYATNLTPMKYATVKLYGKSYLESIIRAVPFISKIYRDILNMDRSYLETYLSKIYPRWFKWGGGLGFSPATEAYMNFGFIGCIFMGYFWGIFFNCLYRKLYNDKYLEIYCIFLSLCFTFSRTESIGFTSEVFWFVTYYLLYNLLLRIITSPKRLYNIPGYP